MIILMSGLLMDCKTAYKVVVLPLPVGPVTRMIPLGEATSFLISLRRPGLRPISESSSNEPDLFKSLRTTRSPKAVGIVDTRRSMF